MREVGAGVAGLARGDRVAAVPSGGGLAEIALARAELAVPVPAEVSLPIAAATPLGLTTALLLLEAGDLAPGDSVLVHSASGGIGSALRAARAAAGRRTTDRDRGPPEKVAAAEQSGDDVAIARGDRGGRGDPRRQ